MRTLNKSVKRALLILTAVLMMQAGLGAGMANAAETPPLEPGTEVLTAAEREQFFQRYFDRMTEPKPLTRFENKESWLAYRTSLRQRILDALGLWPLPERVPLNPQVTGRIAHDTYSVERLYYQVFPRVYASGYLYFPAEAGSPNTNGAARRRLPAVLNPHGHWAQGALHPVVQSRCIALARMGYVAFCPDSTHVADFPIGLCPIGQMTWNNMRALDLLAGLEYVDPERIGCTGASGGGQQTLYLAALDERVKVPVPAVLVSYFRRILFATEQAHCFCNHAPGIAAVTDEHELAAMFAPRPTRFICATGDWTRLFPREEFPQIKHIFGLVGGAVDCVQFDKPHNYDQDSREQMYAWMNRYLKDLTDPETSREPRLTAESPEKLKALSGAIDGEDLEQAPAYYRAKYQFRPPAPASPGDWESYLTRLRSRLRELLGENVPEAPINPRSRGEVDIQGLRAEKWLIDTEPLVSVPGWLFRPGTPQGRAPAVVMLHPAGKAALVKERFALIRTLLERGVMVLALDVRLRGELRRDWRWNTLIWGRPEDGMAAHDLNRAAAWLAARDDVDPRGLYALGVGESGIAALFAVALDSRWAGVALDDVGPLYAEGRQSNLVARVLRHGDLPQFAALIQPRRLWLNGSGAPFEFTAAAYRSFGQSAALTRTGDSPMKFDADFPGWIVAGR